MRVLVAVALFALAMAAQPAMAFTGISIPYITTDCTVFTLPNANTALTILEFNSASTSLVSEEKFDIDFPVFADGFVAGPTRIVSNPGAEPSETSENTIPFGPVNLALPSIGQSAAEIVSCQRTYFFTDTFG